LPPPLYPALPTVLPFLLTVTLDLGHDLDFHSAAAVVVTHTRVQK